MKKLDQDIKDILGMFLFANLAVIAVPFIYLWCGLDRVYKWTMRL